ncbi:MAG: heavy-metal-associated domain-containing protein [Gemmatimonadota bacterium]
MTKTKLRIEGMSCGHCAHAVTQALESVPGVQQARVDLEGGSAEVEHEGADRAALVGAVMDEGYSAEELA